MLMLVRGADVLVVGLGLLGVVLGFLLARQSWDDRRAARQAGRNGWFLMHAVVGIRDGIAVSITHVILGGLGLLALLNPPPIPSRYRLALIFAGAYILVQVVVIALQAANFRDGHRLRHRDA